MKRFAALIPIALVLYACGDDGVAGPGTTDTVVGRFQEGTDGVDDRVTGLTWEQQVNQTPVANWDEAAVYCSGKAGNWRVPQVWELATLFGEDLLPAFGPTDLPDLVFWSTTEFTPTGSAYVVNFGSPVVTLLPKIIGESTLENIGEAPKVWCVRGQLRPVT